MSRSQFAVYQLKKKPELRNLLFRTYERTCTGSDSCAGGKL